MKIIVIEDEENIAAPIIRMIRKLGYIVDYAKDGLAGWKMLSANTYDCIILDLNLPLLDGMEIARRQRERDDLTPILMLTARSQIYDKISGFKTGADDYLTKPFDLQELLARMNALIKRCSLNREIKLHVGKYILDPAQNQLTTSGGGEKVKLSTKETGILEYLIRNRGKTVSAEELLEHVWDCNINMFTSTVKTHIKTLRQKLGDEAELIQTIKGKGYIIYE